MSCVPVSFKADCVIRLAAQSKTVEISGKEGKKSNEKNKKEKKVTKLTVIMISNNDKTNQKGGLDVALGVSRINPFTLSL